MLIFIAIPCPNFHVQKLSKIPGKLTHISVRRFLGKRVMLHNICSPGQPAPTPSVDLTKKAHAVV